MSEATARAALYSRLSETIGVDNAGTLMSYLPGDKPATAAQLDRLEVSTAAEFRRQEDGWKAAAAHLEKSMAAGFDRLEKAMAAESRRVDQRFAGLEARMDDFDDRLTRFDDKLDRRLDEFHFALLAQGRTYVVATVGSVISTAGLVAAIFYSFG